MSLERLGHTIGGVIMIAAIIVIVWAVLLVIAR